MTSRGHLVQPLSQTRASSSWILNISVDRDSITSLDSIFQCLTKFMIKNKLMFSLELLVCQLASIMSHPISQTCERSVFPSVQYLHLLTWRPTRSSSLSVVPCMSCAPAPYCLGGSLQDSLEYVCVLLIMEIPSLGTYSMCGLKRAYQNHMVTRGLFQPQPFCDTC